MEKYIEFIASETVQKKKCNGMETATWLRKRQEKKKNRKSENRTK